ALTRRILGRFGEHDFYRHVLAENMSLPLPANHFPDSACWFLHCSCLSNLATLLSRRQSRRCPPTYSIVSSNPAYSIAAHKHFSAASSISANVALTGSVHTDASATASRSS